LAPGRACPPGGRSETAAGWRTDRRAGNDSRNVVPGPGSSDPQNDVDQLRGAGDVVELRTGDAREAAALARRTLDEGTFAGWSEVLIGGVAENRGGLPIVTGNAHHFPAQETITYG